ncbi:MAG: hypothetical protein Q9159_001082 [Coniocarpon cinnabarinum]
MAIGTDVSPHNVDNFVHADRIWYSSKIPNLHNQLRHMASAPNAHCIYFSNVKDVYKIDTVTKKRRHVTELPFEPKCTATGHGFFCAGDEKGYLAYMRIPEGATALTHASDSPLADLAAASHRLGYSSLLDDPNFLSQVFPSRTRIERVGRDIMNSISIHRINAPCDELDDDIVALITCNDRVVRSWSLLRDREMTIDEFSQPMNHATISPDQQRLVIVGDHDFIYFYRRHEVKENIERLKLSKDQDLQWYIWEQERILQLPTPPRYDSLASFTTAWNEKGNLCATASESGYITVLDVTAINDADDVMDCVVTFVPSSRPESPAGAVRTMCFAPDPWDYLVWAENNGRICVGDLRSGLVARQAVKLDPRAEGVHKVSLTDTSPLQSSILDQPDCDFELEFIRQRQRELGTDVDSFASMTPALHRFSSRHDTGLDEDERQILDNLRTSRERNEAHQATLRDLQGTSNRASPRSFSYLPAARNVNRQEGGPRLAGTHTPIPGTGSGSELARLRQDAAVLDTLRNYMHDTSAVRNRDRDAPASATSNIPPRRRNSVVLSTPGPRFEDRAEDSGSSDPWRTIEAAIARVRDEGPETYPGFTREPPSGRARSNNPSQDPYLSLPPLMQSLGSDDNSQNVSSDAVNVNLPSNSSSRGTSTATGVTLPSLRDPSLRNSMSELSAALPQPQNHPAGPPGPSSNLAPPSLRDPDPHQVLLERQRQLLRARDQLRDDSERERSQERQRERERTWRRDALASRQYETGLLRRVNVTAPLRVLNPQDAAIHRRVHAIPANETEREDWGVGTAGVMIPPLPNMGNTDAVREARMLASGARTLFVGTDEGILELKLDFQTRKRLPAAEWQ